ncbi:hypothetical protein WJX81_002519 [Elliptochloris bilobata]|uniref:Vps53 N-terminal domain-containing protein n=1 Tax=Elliptochloris bilobata TaxID=381761 RepID=A0AAW1QHE8_9CHLO
MVQPAAEPAASPSHVSAGNSGVIGPADTQPDIFDDDNFEATAYINELFPTEASLTGLDSTIGSLKQKIRRVDTEILTAVRQQSSSGSRARQDLGAAKAAIEELFGKIGEIRRKAEASEVMVQEICRDIRKLDYAKTHLTHTITALRRLAMLVNAVDQLQRAVERGEYAEAARLLEAVQQLAAHFAAFGAVPKVAELGGRVAALQTSLQLAAMREFELLGVGEDRANPLLLDRLRACCMVVDVLGPKAREELIESVCRKEMSVYGQIFSTSGETAAVDRTERRYGWLRRRLRAREDILCIFPEPWRVAQRICMAFAVQTRAQLAEILAARAGELGGNVEALLVAVKATNDFEAEMAERFGGGKDAAAEEEGSEGDDASPASRVRQRYERLFKAREREHDSPRAAAAAAAEALAADTAARSAFQGAISSAFVPHLGVYVAAEERGLMELAGSLVAGETWRPMEDATQTHVLHSASQLFGAIKKSLQRCARFVSRGEAMLRLMAAFQRVLRFYAGRLVARLPKTAAGGTTGSAAAGATDWHVRLADDDVPVVCALIATAEYCHEMVGALARSAAKMLDPPLGAQVGVAEEEDAFAGVVTACLSVLVLGAETRLDAVLTQMTRLPWASLESVGDQSDFVTAAARVVAEVAPAVGSALSPLHFRYFCDKLAASFCPRFYETIFRCRKVGEAGSQQLLLDTQAIKALLLDLPSAGRLEEAAGARLAAAVGREMGRAEALLKVVGSRPENLADNFFTLLPTATPADFQRIVDLKVMRRQEQQAVLDAFNRRLGRPGGTGALPRAPPVGVGSTAAASAALAAAGAAAQPGPSPAAPPRGPGATQELMARFRFGGNMGARSSAAAAGEKVRETMAGSLAQLKNLGNLGFSRGAREPT